MRKLSLSSLEKKLDRVFSAWVRRRHADIGGTVQCVTCRRLLFWKESHAGHFIKRQHRATRWRPTNVHCQCVSCNTYKGGQQDEYARFIVETYGLAEFNDLMKAKHQPFKVTRDWLEHKIEEFSIALKVLDMKAAA